MLNVILKTNQLKYISTFVDFFVDFFRSYWFSIGVKLYIVCKGYGRAIYLFMYLLKSAYK